MLVVLWLQVKLSGEEVVHRIDDIYTYTSDTRLPERSMFVSVKAAPTRVWWRPPDGEEAPQGARVSRYWRD